MFGKKADLVPTPLHIAIIMDGNGRWASARGLPRTVGHQQGDEAVKRTVESALDLGVRYLTLFGFSSENWKRPVEEVSELMRLLRYYLHAETARLHSSGIRLRVIGERTAFDQDIVEMIEQAENLTAANDKMDLLIALNYGGRMDILHAVQKVTQEAAVQGRALTYDEVARAFPAALMTAGVPDPDILIRTSGEQRISNFLLWQCAYSEMIFIPAMWPEFGRPHLEQAIADFSKRDRRFGGIKVKSSAEV
jgi:undecaprenyl diphosphate synthase